MDLNNHLQYELALSVLNSMIGICFQDLEAERNKISPDQSIVIKLKAAFADVCRRRDALVQFDASELRAVIDEFAPLVKTRVEMLRSSEQGGV